MIELDRQLLLSAQAIFLRHNVSFWDATIIAAAQSAGATELLSEDIQNGQKFGKLKIRNPFR